MAIKLFQLIPIIYPQSPISQPNIKNLKEFKNNNSFKFKNSNNNNINKNI